MIDICHCALQCRGLCVQNATHLRAVTSPSTSLC